jgi:hypothetical protein
MGYRSDVAYTIRFNSDDDELNKQSFYTFLAEAKTKEDYVLALVDITMHIDEVRYRFDFSASDVKWYEGYPDVDSHMKLLNLADDWIDGEAQPCIGYVFMRIGENPTDIEELYSGKNEWDWIQVSRQLVLDWS